MNKLILNFKSKETKNKNPRNFLGGKGANLSKWEEWVYRYHLVTISTKVCDIFYKDKKLNLKLINQIKELKIVEKDVSKKFGDLKKLLICKSELEFQCLG